MRAQTAPLMSAGPARAARAEERVERAAVRRARGFTLLELLVVVAILGIAAGLATPAIMPILHVERLLATADQVASFGARGRAQAVVDRRCVRLRIDAAAHAVVLERLNVYDCEDPATVPSSAWIEPSAGIWIEFDRLALHPRVTVSLAVPPSETSVGTPEIRYRATGRLFSADDVITDDDGAILLEAPDLTSGPNQVFVLFEAHGPICVLPRGQPAQGTGNDLACP